MCPPSHIVRSQRMKMMRVTHVPVLLSALALCASGASLDRNHSPPPHDEVAAFARYLVHDSSWTAMATLANRDPINDYPFANIFSVSDGPVDSSTGVPYMYLMPLELSAIDLEKNDKASLTMTMAQVDEASSKTIMFRLHLGQGYLSTNEHKI